MKRSRRAFTLVELLVVIAIIGVLVAMLLPAIQAAREAARRSQCVNNMKQLALGCHNHEVLHRSLPQAWYWPKNTPSVTTYYGWGLVVLPHLEQQAIHDLYNFKKHWFDPANQQVVNMRVETFLCASAQDGDQVGLACINEPDKGGPWTDRTAARSDYISSRGYINYWDPRGDTRCPGPMMNITNSLTVGVVAKEVPVKVNKITDGTANTILLGEQSSRHEFWLNGFKQGPVTSPTSTVGSIHWGFIGMWASWASQWGRCSYPDGTEDKTKQCTAYINVNNNGGFYSFHSGGANFAMADGSVKFLTVDIYNEIFRGMLSREQGEVIDGITSN